MVEEVHLTSVETSNSGDVKVNGLFGDEWNREVVERHRKAVTMSIQQPT